MTHQNPAFLKFSSAIFLGVARMFWQAGIGYHPWNRGSIPPMAAVVFLPANSRHQAALSARFRDNDSSQAVLPGVLKIPL
jgi:hypothetical protein